MSRYKISLDGVYGKARAVIAGFAVAVYIVQHSAKTARDVHERCIMWPNYPSFSGTMTTSRSSNNLTLQCLA